MKFMLSGLVGLFLPFCLSHAESPEEAVKRLAAMGPGVHDVQREGSRLLSIKIVAQERVSTVLGATKGLMIAQKRARLMADSEFVRWMKNNVTTIETSSSEQIITLTGDGAGQTESGKATESTSTNITAQAEGLVRGMVLVGKDIAADGKVLTLVFSWSPLKASMAAQAASTGENQGVAPEGSTNQSGFPTADDKKVNSGTVVSPDFNE